jgi:diguanylate cyclase (GGDEF)-like protein
VPKRLRRSLALKLILASAIPSAVVLLAGVGALVGHSYKLSQRDAGLAFEELRTGAVLGTLLALTFAGMTIALAARHFLIKPIHELQRVMRRAEMGEFLVRARVQTEDELGMLAKSFNTMLSRVTDMAVTEIEARQSVARMEGQLSLHDELKAVNHQLEARVGEMELLLEVARSVAGSIDLPEQLQSLGRQVSARLGVTEFSVMLVSDVSRELVVEASIGDGAPRVRALPGLALGQGAPGEAAESGETVYVPDLAKDARARSANGTSGTGALLSVPLRAKGNVLGVMNLRRSRPGSFSPQEIRLVEGIAAQSALAVANARLYRETLELSYTDPLTGVSNRRQLLQRLDQEHSHSVRFGDGLSVLMLDIDHFKEVNDTYGHLVGDAVLKALAQLLRRNVRKVDVVARYGGDEFCIVLPRVGRADALEVAEKLRRTVAFATLHAPEGAPPLRSTISVGIATLGVDAHDVESLLRTADQALIEAKQLGRDRVASTVHASA